jgi:hypothetical protein
MVERNSFIRAANEVSLAVWFGGALMGATGVARGAGATDGDPHRVESAAWSAWQPIQVAAIATQLASGAALTLANRKRVAGQRGVARTSAIRTGLTGAAVAMTVLAARTGNKIASDHDSDGDSLGFSRKDADANAEADGDERRLRVAQWMVPALTGAIVVMDAFMGEQQRPNQVVRGALERILPDALRAA